MLAAMARTGAGTTRSEYAKSCAVEALQVLSGQSCESSVQHATAIMQLRHATATHKCTMDLRNKKKHHGSVAQKLEKITECGSANTQLGVRP